jgi:hypothetical protein
MPPLHTNVNSAHTEGMRRTHIYQFTFGLGAGVCGQFLDKVWPQAPLQLYLVLEIGGGVLMLYAVCGAVNDWFRPGHPQHHETDVYDVLRYLLYETKWSERQIRKLNFREALDHLEEFRRAARDDGLRTSGISKFGGHPQTIDSRHWDGAQIDPRTIDEKGRVCTQSFAPSDRNPGEFCALKATTEDFERIWPRASSWGRILTRTIVATKKLHYGLLSRDARETRGFRWRTIRDNFRDRPDRAPLVAKPSGDGFWPDFDRWDKEPILRLYQAACLWCDEEPSLPMPSAARTQFESLRDALYSGDLTGHLSLDESIRAAWGRHIKRANAADDPITVNTKFKRDQLIAYAEKTGERPRFLFPAARSQ